jgi:hypothetical protein
VVNPNITFLQAEVSFTISPFWAYDVQKGTLEAIPDNRVRIVQWASRYYELEPRMWEFWQARSPGTNVYDGGGGTSHVEEWLPGLRDVAKNTSDSSSWLPYWRSLIGEGDHGQRPKDGATVTKMKLSALFLLFMKSSNADTNAWPVLGNDGIWKLPGIDGNMGNNEYLAVFLSDDVTVQVA